MQITTLGRKILRSDVLGSFDFLTMLISLESLRSTAVGAAAPLFVRDSDVDVDGYGVLNHLYPLAAHEATHFVDATSTLWGLRHLDMFNAAHAGLESRREPNFHFAKKFYDHLKSIKLPDYYTVVVDRPVVRPWKYSPTVGRMFDHGGQVASGRPVFFCQFADEQEALLARSPLSSVSVLEASAMAQELFMRLRLLARLEDGARSVEWRLEERRLLSHLYDHALTEYSVCVHLAANEQNCQDVIAAFRVTALLTGICLNFPASAYETLAGSHGLADLMGWRSGSEEVTRLAEALSACDMGALYCVLVRLLPVDAYVDMNALLDGVRAAENRLGIVWDSIWDEAEAEANALGSRLAGSDIEELRLIADSGLRNFQSIDKFRMALPFETLDIPQMHFGDDVSHHVLGSAVGSLSRINPEQVFDALFPISRNVQSFGDACM